ncbi:hypothetical protein GCM10009612_62470 [Streptomyces beijiangensis]
MSADPRPPQPPAKPHQFDPAHPTRTWATALRRTPVSMWNDDIADHAAALTYYAILTVLHQMLTQHSAGPTASC